MIRSKLTLLILLTLFISSDLFSSSNHTEGLFDIAEPSFIRANTGNHEVSIVQMVKSDSGRLWTSSSLGIFYYDGYEYKNIDFTDESGNKYGNFNSVSIVKGEDGIIWSGSLSQGLFRFNEKTRKFKNYAHNPNDANSLLPTRIWNLLVDGDKGLWIGTKSGLSYHDFETESFTHYIIPQALIPNGVVCLIFGDENNLILGSQAGLFEFDLSSHEVKRFAFKNPVDWSKVFVSEITKDADGRLWISSMNTGAHLIDSDRSAQHLGDFGWVQDIKIVDDEAWLASGSRGVIVLDYQTGNFKREYRADLYRPGALGGNDLSELYVDPDGLIWIAGWQSSLWLVTPSRKYSRSLLYSPSKRVPIAKSDVSAAIEVDDAEIWVSSRSQGIDIFDLQSGYSRSLTTDSHPKLPSNYIEAMLKSQDGSIWIITKKHGVWLYRKNKRSDSKEVIHEGAWSRTACTHNGKVSNMGLPVISELIEGEVFILAVEGVFKLITAPSGECHLKEITTGTQRVVLGGGKLTKELGALVDFGSVYKISRNSFQAEKISVLVEGDENEPEPEFEAVYSTNTGKLFFYTGEKLYEKTHFDGENLSLKLVYQGAINPAIFYEDGSGNLWGGSGYRLANQDVLHTLSIADGQIYAAGDFKGVTNSRSGMAISAYARGLTFFRFSEFEQWSSQAAPLAIQSGTINGINSERVYGDFVLQPDENDFTLNFAAIDLVSADSIRYRYFLEGYSNNWTEVDSHQRFASYTNLSPGDFVFRLQSTNRYGEWSDQELRISISVLPAWYQTIYFYIGCLFFVLFSFYGFYLWRLSYYKRQKVELEQLVSERTEDLAQSLQDLKSTQKKLVISEKQASLGRLVSGVAHEINTPLGVIKMAFSTAKDSAQKIFSGYEMEKSDNPQLMSLLEKHDKSHTIIEGNLGRLSGLVDSFKKISVSDEQWTLSQLSPQRLLENVVTINSSIASQKNIKLHIETDPKLVIYSYSELLGEIISVLICTQN